MIPDFEPPVRDAIAAIKQVRRAFGAPGDHGYDTPQGDALFALYAAGLAQASLVPTDPPEAT